MSKHTGFTLQQLKRMDAAKIRLEYQIEKNAGNIAEARKCLSNLKTRLGKRGSHPVTGVERGKESANGTQDSGTHKS